jgi:hypothetical protein
LLFATLVAAGCGPGEPGVPQDAPGSDATADTATLLTPSPRGRAAGKVVDPSAAIPIAAIPVDLVRVDTGEVVDSGMSGVDGSYALDVPTDPDLPDGTLLQVQARVPPDHVFAYAYATPTAFPAGVGRTLRHDIQLTGP